MENQYGPNGVHTVQTGARRMNGSTANLSLQFLTENEKTHCYSFAKHAVSPAHLGVTAAAGASVPLVEGGGLQHDTERQTATFSCGTNSSPGFDSRILDFTTRESRTPAIGTKLTFKDLLKDLWFPKQQHTEALALQSSHVHECKDAKP